MGLHRKDKRLFARIYSSRTLENILGTGRAAANIVYDPVLFVQSALSDVEHERLEFVEGFPVLKDAPGWILFDCNCKKGKDISVVELIPVEAKINHKIIKPVNRGFNAVIEALIHATRYVSLKEPERLEQIDYYNTIVQKCGGAREKDAMRLLYELIGYKNKLK